MLNYIGAELYKAFRRKYLYLTLLFTFLGEALLVVSFVWFNSQVDAASFFRFDDWLKFIAPLLLVGIYMGIIVCDLVFSEQYKHNTLKNEVSFGIPRTHVYLGKLISQLIVGTVLCVLLIGTAILLGFVCFPAGENISQQFMRLGCMLLTSLPLWFGAVALCNMMFFLLKNSTAASIVTVLFFTMGGSFIGMMRLFPVETIQNIFIAIHSVLLTTPIENANAYFAELPNWGFIGNAWLIGMGWLVITTILGAVLFNKREIT